MITSQLTTFFAGLNFQAARQIINTTGRAFVIRSNDQAPIDLTNDQIDDILHQYAPELSATVSGTTIVIFHDRQNDQHTV